MLESLGNEIFIWALYSTYAYGDNSTKTHLTHFATSTYLMCHNLCLTIMLDCILYVKVSKDLHLLCVKIVKKYLCQNDDIDEL